MLKPLSVICPLDLNKILSDIIGKDVLMGEVLTSQYLWLVTEDDMLLSPIMAK